MSWANRIVGIFVERVDEEVGELPEELPPSPRRSPSPSASAAVSPSPATSIDGAVPAEIRQVVDSHFDEAAAPALSAWVDLNTELSETLADPNLRSRTVLITLRKMGHTPQAIFTDIEECREQLTNLKREVQEAKDAEITERAVSKEKEAETCRAQITQLEAQIRELQTRAASLDEEALQARAAIDRNQVATLRYIDTLSRTLDSTAHEVRSASPVEPARK